jgi:hypothetical protein
VGPTCQDHLPPRASYARDARARKFLLPSIPLYSLLNAAPLCAYLTPASSSPFPPSLCCGLRRQAAPIPHQRPAVPPPCIDDSDAYRWPRRPFMVPPSLLHPGAPPQVLGSSYFAAKRCKHHRLKITSARSSSSRSSAMVLDSPDLVELTIGLPSPFRSLSTPSLVPEAARASPSLSAWMRPRRRRPAGNPNRWDSLPDSSRPSDFDLTHQIDPLNRISTGWSSASNHLLIRWPSTLIRPNRYPPTTTRHVSASGLNRNQFRISNQN